MGILSNKITINTVMLGIKPNLINVIVPKPNVEYLFIKLPLMKPYWQLNHNI